MPVSTIFLFYLRIFHKDRIPAITTNMKILRNDNRDSRFRNCYRHLRTDVDREAIEKVKRQIPQLLSNTNRLGCLYTKL